LVRASGSLPPP
jgi:hypothetical protein